mmetsp:Transcript_12366/g.29625  ORF Transcript_12366/g.29625 Transcript_12366/m.29625 type:complete len:1418 (-) Transcript_12366:162-4415(-)
MHRLSVGRILSLAAVICLSASSDAGQQHPATKSQKLLQKLSAELDKVMDDLTNKEESTEGVQLGNSDLPSRKIAFSTESAFEEEPFSHEYGPAVDLRRHRSSSRQPDGRNTNLRAHIFGQHVFYLAPFQQEALNDVFAAESDDAWRGYTGEQEDGTIDLTSRALFETAIARLRDAVVDTGGRFMGSNVVPRSVWNGPATGGYTISMMGMGFGWKARDGNECSDQCLQNPDACSSATCFFMRARIGDTSVQDLRWTSDSSITFAVSPGLGTSHTIAVEAGRLRSEAFLPEWFTYDTPTVSAIAPVNSVLAGGSYFTVYGKNYGATANSLDVRVGSTSCNLPKWTSDSAITCNTIRRGTGAFYPVEVNIGNTFASVGNPFAPQGRISVPSLSQAFTYDKPKITAIYPANGPPAGYVTAVTIFGINFGLGPELIQPCPQDTGDNTYLLKPLQTPDCQPGFPRFRIAQSIGGQQTAISWDNIKPYAMVLDPIACVLNTYQCDSAGRFETCRYIKDSCKPLSNETVQRDLVRETISTCTFPDPFGNTISCPPHVISGYVKDGVDCNTQGGDYFQQNQIFATDQICDLTANHPSQCTGCRDGEPYCCNTEGAIGARVRATECVTLTWRSSSSMVCRVAPGLGFGHPIMVAIDDFKGGQVDVLPNAFTFDAPRVSSISRAANPTSGGTTATFLGEMFGTFQCTTRCSFDADLLLCNSTGCGRPGDPPRAKSVRHSASLKASYDGSDAFRTACQTVSWTSDTAMTCVLSPGTGDLRTVQITVAGTENEFAPELRAFREDRSVRYLPPTVTSLSNSTLPATGGSTLSVFGHNFGKWDTGPQARLAGTSCITTGWVSDSSLTCIAPAGMRAPRCSVVGVQPEDCLAVACESCVTDRSTVPETCVRQFDTYDGMSGQGFCGSVVVTVDRLRGLLTSVFSYQSGTITGINPSNGPPVGNLNVTILGTDFGDRRDYGYTASLGGSNCKQVTWISDSAIACSVPMGISLGHEMRVRVEWNNAIIVEPSVRFSFDIPVIDVAVPQVVPTKGDIAVTLFGSNFGANPEFVDPNRVLSPVPPKVRIGDTLCYRTQWQSDTTTVCVVSNAATGRGPGVGGNLPLEMDLGGQQGVLSPYGYEPPRIVRGSSINGAATGGNILQLIGDSFGTYDYTPTAIIGVTDCKLTQWTSNTAIACTTAPCTTFLAGLNVDLPIQVEVGLGHRLDSDQVGLLDRYYTYDRPIEIFFNLNNIEINFLLFSGAVLIAAAIVCCLHVQYRKHWRPPMPDLPTRYARTPLDDQAKIRPHKIMPIDQKRFEDENKDSSSSDSGFYDFEDGEEGEFNPEEADRLDSAFRLGRDATMAVQTKKAINSSTPLLGKDVVTGQTVVYEEDEDERDHAAGVGFVQASVMSVRTPMPRQHLKKHHRHEPEGPPDHL